MKYIKTSELFKGHSITNALKQDLNASINQYTDLMRLINRDDLPEFIKFLENGDYNLEDTDTEGNTALLIAAREGKLFMMKRLIKAGANFAHKNKNGEDFYDLTTKRYKFINRPKDWIEKEFGDYLAAKKYNI